MARANLFCEDSGHELYARALLKRLADEEALALQLVPRSTRGGHGRAISELRAWQRALRKGLQTSRGDLLVVLIDANCQGWHAARHEVTAAIDTTLFPRVVVGCPDPHVERWCLADPAAVQQVIGTNAAPDPDKCERGLYKRILEDALLAADLPILGDPMDYAPELVRATDLYSAAKRQPSIGSFVSELRAALRSMPRA
jgi:hypothetical protein